MAARRKECRFSTAALLLLSGCAGLEAVRVPQASRDLDGWRSALVTAHEHHDAALFQALARSRAWLELPASRAGYPLAPGVTHERVRESLAAFEEVLREAKSADSFADTILERFEFVVSPGRDSDGEVLFTAYFAPTYPASRVATPRYRFPLHAAPLGLSEREPRPPWSSRAEIEREELLAGRELAWLDDALNAYLVHVNGSACLFLEDGARLHLGHVGTNGANYTSLGRLLIEAGLSTPEEMSLQKIRELHEREPERVEALMLENDRYVFFEELEERSWPRSSLGIPLTPFASIATDKTVFPAGALALVETRITNESGRDVPFVRFVLDQDSGGAILGAGRADLYFGVGSEAGRRAGAQQATGRLTTLLLRPDVSAR